MVGAGETFSSIVAGISSSEQSGIPGRYSAKVWPNG
jgi:hypothetical protein